MKSRYQRTMGSSLRDRIQARRKFDTTLGVGRRAVTASEVRFMHERLSGEAKGLHLDIAINALQMLERKLDSLISAVPAVRDGRTELTGD